jgi:hypothetical protein
MSIKTTKVSRSLDKKLKLFGFEVFDLLLVFLLLAILNLMFGGGGIVSVATVWLPPAFLALSLRILKRGKPEKFLFHEIKYRIDPGIYSAFFVPPEMRFPLIGRKMKKK